MRTTLRHCLRLIEEQPRRRWAFVLALALLASVIEAMAAVMIFVLIKLVNEPNGALDVSTAGRPA